MIDIRKKLGFIRLKVDDYTDQIILSAFCEGKGYLWNLFFGWKKSIFKKDGSCIEIYYIPKNNVNTLLKMSASLKKPKFVLDSEEKIKKGGDYNDSI